MYNLVIVDDETYILEGLKNVIDWKNLGFQVVATFFDGEEAFEFVISNSNVDVVLSDIRMPRKDGISMIEDLREAGLDNLEVVFLSGYEDFNYAQKAISLSASEYILKPSSPEAIQAAFEKVKAKLDARKLLNKKPHIVCPIKIDVEEDSSQSILCESIIDYVGNNYMHPINVQAIATEFMLTPNYLGRIFFECTGRRLKDFINELRISKALEILETGRYKKYEVALMVGFQNYDYFRKIIKKAESGD